MNEYIHRSKFRFVILPLLFLAFVFGLTGCGPQQASPKYVFMFIGDGMGLSQVHAAEMYLGATQSGRVGIQKLSFSEFPAQGYMTTYAENAFVTDSAAAATAMATGVKTRNGRISMDESGDRKLQLITQGAKDKGLKVGIISNVPLSHATPACYYARVPYRWQYYNIALEIGRSPFDFFGGGGFVYPTGRRGGEPDALEIARENGFKVVTTKQEFLHLQPGPDRIIAFNEVLTHEHAMPYEIDRAQEDLPLSAYIEKAIELLDNPQGFFLMTEGGKIDWACHDNDAGSCVRDVLAFDAAVGEAIAFYEEHPRDTLIIVTADHECGGMGLRSDRVQSDISIALLGQQKMSITQFVETVIEPYRAMKKEEEWRLADLIPEIEIKFGLCILNEDEQSELRRKAKEGDNNARMKLELALSPVEMTELQSAFDSPNEKALQFALVKIMSNKAGISWAGDGHTAVPVPVFALGAGQDFFNGYYDNTDIAKKLSSLMGISLE